MPTTTPQHTGKNQSGIAMLGIVLVIVIILIALVSAVSLGPQLQNIANERQTSKRANVIVDAMKQYYLARGVLPEPSSVPVGDLNLEQKYRFDAWGQAWEYHRAVTGGNPDIVGMSVDGQQVAGVLISGGPDQVIQTDRSDLTNISKAAGSDDIIIPINVQGEAIQIAKNELEVLARGGKGCPLDDRGLVPGQVNIYFVEWDDPTDGFLGHYGLSESYKFDPWTESSDNREYYWYPVSGLEQGYWVSLGPDGQQIRSRLVDCTTGGPPGTPLTHIDFTHPDFTVGMSPNEIADAHPDIAEAGSGASIVIDPATGETVLSLSGTSSGWVRLESLVTDPIDFCEYTVMGWFKSDETVTTTFSPIIVRHVIGAPANRTWWINLWNSNDSQWSSSPLVQRVGPSFTYFNIGVGEGRNFFRPTSTRVPNWNFFATNMSANNSGYSVNTSSHRCEWGSGSYLFTNIVYGSRHGEWFNLPSEELLGGGLTSRSLQSRPIGPYVGADGTMDIELGRQGSRYFRGYISEIVIYGGNYTSGTQQTLEDEEIRTWYDTSKARYRLSVDGLVAEYLFEVEQNLGRDTSGNRFHGDLENVNEVQVVNPASLVDSAFNDGTESTCRYLNFSGNSGSSVQMGSVDLGLQDEMTVMAWVRWRSDPSGGPSWANIVSSSRTPASDGQFWFQHNENNTQFEFAVRTETGRSWVYSNDEVVYNPTQDIWMHVAGVYNGSNLTIYVNGVLQDNTSSRTGNILASTSEIEMAIGCMPTSCSRRFPGDIDEVRIFNRALNPTEIDNWRITTRPCD